jgi:hypothetical protein
VVDPAAPAPAVSLRACCRAFWGAGLVGEELVQGPVEKGLVLGLKTARSQRGT